MRKERYIFELRRKDYIDRARLALDAVNRATEKLNSYGSCFGIWGKEDIKKKCDEVYISESLKEKLNIDRKSGVYGKNLERRKYRYGLIEKELLEPAKAAKEALKTFGRFMVYNEENYSFRMNEDKLERYALQYAEELE